MKLRIGNIEIIDPTIEELGEIIKLYGGGLTPDVGVGEDGGVPSQKSAGKSSHGGGGGTTDKVVLKTLVDAGTVGVSTTHLGDMLGRRGKATRGAVRLWAKRVGLVQDETLDPFEECRVGTTRGLRIKPSLAEVAKALLSH